MAILRKKINGQWVDTTPEEQKQSEAEGQEFIRQRGKIEEQTGLNTRNAGVELSRLTELANPPGSVIEAQARADLEKTNIQKRVQEEAKNKEIAGRALTNQDILSNIGKVNIPEETQETQTETIKSNPLDVSGGITLDTRGIQQVQQQGTIPSELAIPLATGNIAAGGAMGGLTAIPAVTAAAAPAVAQSQTLGSAIKGLSVAKAGLATLGLGSIGAFLGKVSGDRKQKVKVANAIFTSSIKNMNDAIKYANSGGDPQQAMILYNQAVSDIYESESYLKALSKQDIPFFAESNGKDELAKIESFRKSQFVSDNALRNAIINPNPNAVFLDTINAAGMEQQQ